MHREIVQRLDYSLYSMRTICACKAVIAGATCDCVDQFVRACAPDMQGKIASDVTFLASQMEYEDDDEVAILECQHFFHTVRSQESKYFVSWFPI